MTKTSSSNNNARRQVPLLSTCRHSRLILHQESANCQDCGIFISSTGQTGIKIPASSKQITSYWNLSSLQLLNNMKIQQSQSHFVSAPNDQATYLTSRKNLIETITTLSDRLNLAKLTTHHAVRYLDQVLSHIQFPKTRLRLVALCCSLIAAKFDQLDDNIPLIRDYMRVMKYSFNFQAIEECEKFILSILDWNLKVTTPCHFLLIYLRQGILFESDMIKSEEREIQDVVEKGVLQNNSNFNIIADGKSKRSKKRKQKKQQDQSNNDQKYIPVLRSNIQHGNQLQKLIKRVRKYAEYLLDLVLEDYKISYEFKASIVASSCVYAARECNNVKPVWSSNLVTITGYYQQDLYQCVERMKNLFSDVFRFPESQKQQEIKKRKAIKQNSILKLIACPKYDQNLETSYQTNQSKKSDIKARHHSNNSVSTLDSINQKLCHIASRQASLHSSCSDSTNNASIVEDSDNQATQVNLIIQAIQSQTLISSQLINSQLIKLNSGDQIKTDQDDLENEIIPKKLLNDQDYYYQSINIRQVAEQIRKQNGYLNKQNKKCGVHFFYKKGDKIEDNDSDFKDIKVKNVIDWKPIIKLKPVQIVSLQNSQENTSDRNDKASINNATTTTTTTATVTTTTVTDKLKGLR